MSDNKTSKKPNKIKDLEREIILESIKITKNEVSSCYDLVIKTKELIKLYELRDM